MGLISSATYGNYTNYPEFSLISSVTMQIKSPAYVLGEQLALLAEKIMSVVRSNFPIFTSSVALAGVEHISVGCHIPTGSYETSCHRRIITYLVDEAQCELTARCETLSRVPTTKPASFRFFPRGATVSLKNQDGVLVRERLQEKSAHLFCSFPEGPYKASCYEQILIYLRDVDQCELLTACKTMGEKQSVRQASILFSPDDASVLLENHNGTLVIEK